MDVEHKRSFAFLFSLAALPMAGCPASDDTETATNADSSSTGNDPSTSTSNSTTATTTTATTTSADTTLSTTNDPTTESGTTTPDTESTSTGTGSSSGSSDEAPESSSDSTGAEVDPACEAFTDHFVDCYPKYAMYAAELAAECTYGLIYYAGYSAACGMAYEELLSCLTAAECEDILGETACIDEQSAADMACPDGKESTTSVGTGVEGGNDEGGEDGPVSDDDGG